MTRIICIVVFSCFLSSVQALFEFGLKAGVSSLDLADNAINISNNQNSTLSLAVSESNYGYHFGVYSRVSFLGIYVEPALLFNSSQVNYNISEQIFDEEVVEITKSEKYEKLDIPLLVGYKLGFFRVQGGPVAHLHLNSVSELTDINGYGQKFKDATYGYQLGVGLDILKVRLDLNYEGNLSNYGDHIVVDGQEFSFGESPARLVASLGYRF